MRKGITSVFLGRISFCLQGRMPRDECAPARRQWMKPLRGGFCAGAQVETCIVSSVRALRSRQMRCRFRA
jgi:hypothetical protein